MMGQPETLIILPSEARYITEEFIEQADSRAFQAELLRQVREEGVRCFIVSRTAGAGGQHTPRGPSVGRKDVG